MVDQIKAKNSGNIAFTITENLNLEDFRENSENTIISEDFLTEEKIIVRTRQPSFGSIIPHFSKNKVNASQPVTITQPAALQVPTALQASQKFESTVRSNRSIPRNTTVSYGQTTREGLKGNYSMTAFRQSSIELRQAPFELQLPASHATEMEAVMDKLEYEYPGTNVNVSQIYEKEGEVYLPTNQLSLIGTSLRYRNCSAAKNRFSDFVTGRKLSLIENKTPTEVKFVNRGQLEGDHACNIVEREMLKINKAEGGAVFMGKIEHELLGNKRKYLLPDEIGYTPGTAGAMALIDFIESDNASAIKVVFVENGSEALYAKGYNEEVVSRGYKNASNIDRETVQEKIAISGVDENIFLALNTNQIFNTGIAQNYDNFIALVNDKDIDCKTACKDLNRITYATTSRRNHAFSLGANLKTDTQAWRSFNLYEERAKGACDRAYQYVASMPDYSESYIDKEAKERVLGNMSDKPLSLEEAVLITKEESNLKSLKKHPKPLYGANLYGEHYKKK